MTQKVGYRAVRFLVSSFNPAESVKTKRLFCLLACPAVCPGGHGSLQPTGRVSVSWHE